MNSDILVIGGGVIGLSIARLLRKQGHNVSILEKSSLGTEASHAAAGMLAPNAEFTEHDLFYELCAFSNSKYISLAEELIDETGIDIELDPAGTFFAAFDERESAELRTKLERNKKLGLPVEYLSAEETRKAEPFISPDVRESIYFPNDNQIETRRLLSALIRFADLNNITILENVDVTEINEKDGVVTAVSSDGMQLKADKVVIAAGSWSGQINVNCESTSVDVKPIRGQIILFQTAKRVFHHVVYSLDGYIVPRLDGRILVGATIEDVGFDRTITKAAESYLMEKACRIAPSFSNLHLIDHWAGFRPATPDLLPVIGKAANCDAVFYATGHYRNGILLAPATAEIISDLIAGKGAGKFASVYDPRRFDASQN